MKLRLKSKLLPALVVSTLGALSLPSHAAQFSGVYIFGDSLSDAGFYRPGLAALVGQTAANGLGRFTTNPGPVWSELVSQRYGVNPNPSNVNNGNIFAQGGMRVSQPSPPSLLGPGGAQRPVSTQITEFLARGSGGADPNALYGVWVGANDLFVLAATPGLTAADQAAFISSTATAEIQQIARLRAAGARYIMVFNIPDLGATPQSLAGGAAAIQAGTAASVGYNTALFAGLQGAGINVIPVDTFSLLSDVRANAAAFGFTNISSVACLPAGSSSLTCSAANLAAQGANINYLFADGVHPTTGAHRIVADFTISLIEGPQQYSLLAEAPLRSRESHIRTLDTGLLTGAKGGVGKWMAFAAVDGSKFDLDATGINPQLKSDQQSLSIGVTNRVSESTTLGIAIGKTDNDAKFGNNLGKFDTRENTISAFGSVKLDGFYANAALSVSDVKFRNVERNVVLGTVTRTARADTTGSNSSGHVALGYDFEFGKLSVGPQVSVTSQNVTVNAFSESGSGSADLKILKQTRNSTVTSFGIRASYEMGRFTPFVRFTYDQEQKGSPREVGATPLSLATGNTYYIPGFVGDEKWSTATVGVRGSLTDRIGLSLMYSGVQGKSGTKQDGFAANLAFQF